jgi:hypothetical protein
MPQIGGKNAKKTSSDLKRHFTVVMGNKSHGLYLSSIPSSAARKAVTKLCTANKGKKVEFYIREITQGSKKKTYGPYLGYIEKLDKPIELKGRVIQYKPVVKLIGKTSKKIVVKKMKGGLIQQVEIIFEGNLNDIKKITDNWISESLFDFDLKFYKFEKKIIREKNKLIIRLRNLSDENLAKLYSLDFCNSVFDMFIEYGSEIEDKDNFKIYIKKYLSNNKETLNELISYIRIAFCIYFNIQGNILKSINTSCRDIFRKLFNTENSYYIDYKNFRNKQPNFKNFKDKKLYYVFEGFTTLKDDKLLEGLKELDDCLETIRTNESFIRSWEKIYNSSTHNQNSEYNTIDENAENFLTTFSSIIKRWGKLKPKIIDIEGNILLEV